MIPSDAVEAAAQVFIEVDPLWPDGAWEDMADEQRENARGIVAAVLEAAAPHLIPQAEWGIFRVTDDASGEPIENRRYRTREIAERHLRYDYATPDFWEVRGRAVGEWTRAAQ